MGRRLNKKQREEWLSRVARLYLQGKAQYEIAQEVGVTHQQISYDMKVLYKRWMTASADDFKARKEMELAKIDELERVYWQGYHRSLEDKETSSTKRKEPPIIPGQPHSPAALEAMLRKEERDGNPEFLKGIQWCINKRCEIRGHDAPRKNELTGRAGGPIESVHFYLPDNNRDNPTEPSVEIPTNA
jgi:hypothetical protein